MGYILYAFTIINQDNNLQSTLFQNFPAQIMEQADPGVLILSD